MSFTGRSSLRADSSAGCCYRLQQVVSGYENKTLINTCSTVGLVALVGFASTE